MNDLIVGGGEKGRMTSREIAELAGKNHFDVLRDVRSLIEQGAITDSNFAVSTYKDASGRHNPMYSLDFKATMTLVTGYDAKRRAMVIDRWISLETAVATTTYTLPATFAEALHMLANTVEEKELALKQRDIAIKTKAYISDTKTATAMATASVAVRKQKQLENELGRGRDYKAAKAIPWVSELLTPSKGMWSMLGKKLVLLSAELGHRIERIENQEFGHVNAYHVDVIDLLRKRLDADWNMLGSYRAE